MLGAVEIITRYFASGWIDLSKSNGSLVVAELGENVIGIGRADIRRRDLDQHGESLRAFLILFDMPIEGNDLEFVTIRTINSAEKLPIRKNCRKDNRVGQQVFVMGSPRSGTSELSGTIAEALDLAWIGECHIAPAFAAAGKALAGDEKTSVGIKKFSAFSKLNIEIFEMARKGYYMLHGSARFLDKTPGFAMINAAPFLNKCFSNSKFIFVRRNGISNVLSRQTKFGGRFESHCRDWAAAMDAWIQIREELPHFIEIEQEEMLLAPESVASNVARYLDCPENAERMTRSLKTGSRERTGAGIGRTKLADTGWTEEQTSQFRLLCGPTMLRWGYKME